MGIFYDRSGLHCSRCTVQNAHGLLWAVEDDAHAVSLSAVIQVYSVISLCSVRSLPTWLYK